jgi:cell division protein FtsZ
MPINLQMPDITELKPRLMVFGVGGAGGNAVNNMIAAGLQGVEFVVANTDAQALQTSRATRVIQMGVAVTEGLGAGSHPEVGRAAAEESLDEIRDHLTGSHMTFITAGMGGGTGTGAAPVVARAAKEMGILTVGVVTKPFHFEGNKRQKTADAGILELQKHVDTLIVIPNQNLFRVANEKTTFADAFAMADQVLYSGVACITDLMVKEGLINLDFADVRSVMREMGKAMMGTGESKGDRRAILAAEAAISNPLLDDVSMRGARGLLISITGGRDMTLYELDEAATRIREEVDPDANIIVGATYDDALEGIIRVSVVATGIDVVEHHAAVPRETAVAEAATRLAAARAAREQRPAQTSVPVQPLLTPEMLADPQPAPMPPVPAPAPEPVPVAHDPAVTIRQIQPPPSLFIDHDQRPAPVPEPQPVQQTFVPPEPVRPETRLPRMPAIQDLPIPAQRAIEAARAKEQTTLPDPHAEKREGIMSRLAALGGLKRREDGHAQEAPAAPQAPQPVPAPVPRPTQAAPRPAMTTQPPAAPRRPGPEPQPLPRQRQAELDASGRPVPRQHEEGELDIPAFLRRQSH